MAKQLNTTLLILGGGPGGYAAAIRAGQLGIPTILVEGADLGGTCLNVGCIPSKAWIHLAQEMHAAQARTAGNPLGIQAGPPVLDLARAGAWKAGIVDRLTQGVGGLLKKHRIQRIAGWGRIVDGKTVDVTLVSSPGAPGAGGEIQRIVCEHLLLATGSETQGLPALPFGGPIISSTEALSPTALPRSLLVVGAGYIGLELGMAYRKLGVAVTCVESAARILPAYDADLGQPVQAALRDLGIDVHLNTRVLGLAERASGAADDAHERRDNEAEGPNAGHGAHRDRTGEVDEGAAARVEQTGVRVQDSDGREKTLWADQILLAIGRKPRSRGFGLSALMLDMDGLAVRVDARCQTSMTRVWAVGDLTGEPMLAHRAMAQGECVAEQIAGQKRQFIPAAIPAVCFTDPEVVTAGWTAAQAADAGIETRVGRFPLAATGRALTLDRPAGFVRVVARADNHLILGWQAVGAGVSELSAAFAQSLEMGARLEDVAHTIHAHPTLGEAVQEAALQALGRAIHI